MKTIEITCKQACNKLKQGSAYNYDLNIYRGCAHGCQYCYALYSHEFVDGAGSGHFFDRVAVKTNVGEALRKQFASSAWKGDVVNIGSVCDSYQPAEKQYELMRQVLKIFIEFRNPCIISTKSVLLSRDLDLISRLSSVAHVNIACTITAFDETIRKKIEPGAAPSADRFALIKRVKENTEASCGIHIMPMIPFLTDDCANLEQIYRGAKEAGADYVLPSFLNLKGPTRGHFLDFFRREYPNIFPDLISLYQGEDAKKKRGVHKGEVYQYIRTLQTQYDLYSNYMAFSGQKKKTDNDIQLSIF